jgi:hypothetical protein
MADQRSGGYSCDALSDKISQLSDSQGTHGTGSFATARFAGPGSGPCGTRSGAARACALCHRGGDVGAGAGPAGLAGRPCRARPDGAIAGTGGDQPWRGLGHDLRAKSRRTDAACRMRPRDGTACTRPSPQCASIAGCGAGIRTEPAACRPRAGGRAGGGLGRLGRRGAQPARAGVDRCALVALVGVALLPPTAPLWPEI